jgi:hypothetical protein
LGDMWREEKHEKRGLVPTGRGQRGRCGNGPAAARAAQRVRTGEASGSLTCETQPAAGEGRRREARGHVG